VTEVLATSSTEVALMQRMRQYEEEALRKGLLTFENPPC